MGTSFGGFLKNQVVITSNSFDTKILVKFGDLFAEKGWKAIAVNDFFDSVVDDEIVSRNSLHGEVIMRDWHGDARRWQEQVYDDLGDVEYESTPRPKGNVKRYKIGTTVRANSNDNHYLFVALGKTNVGDNVTHATAASLVCAVRQLLVRARSVCANQPLILPLFGSGLSRVGVKSVVLVDLILAAVFEETKVSKITDTIVVVLPNEKKSELDLGEIMRGWN